MQSYMNVLFSDSGLWEGEAKENTIIAIYFLMGEHNPTRKAWQEPEEIGYRRKNQ